MFGYGVSDYVREFGLNVNTDALPMGINGRVLPVPKLQYGKQKGTNHEVVRHCLPLLPSLLISPLEDANQGLVEYVCSIITGCCLYSDLRPCH